MFNNKDIRTTSLDIILISLFLTLNTYFTIFSSVLMVDFEQVKVCYVMVYSGLFLILEFSCKGWFEKCISVGYPDPGRREKNELRFLFFACLCCLERFYEGLIVNTIFQNARGGKDQQSEKIY